jgi:cell division protein FtsB
MVLILFVFNDMGLIKYFQLKKQNQKLIEEINSVRNERKELSKKIVKLESDLEYIEKIAREEFRMAKQGEKVFRVIHKNTNEENQP